MEIHHWNSDLRKISICDFDRIIFSKQRCLDDHSGHGSQAQHQFLAIVILYREEGETFLVQSTEMGTPAHRKLGLLKNWHLSRMK